MIDASLLEEQELPGGETRVAMLETIREYALEQLEASGEAEALRQQHARYYVTWAGVRPGDRVVAEADNLRAALQWTLERGEVELGLPLVDALTVIGWFPETRRIRTLWHQAVRARLDTLPPVLRVQALIRLGIEAWSEQDFAVASAHLEPIRITRQHERRSGHRQNAARPDSFPAFCPSAPGCAESDASSGGCVRRPSGASRCPPPGGALWPPHPAPCYAP